MEEKQLGYENEFYSDFEREDLGQSKRLQPHCFEPSMISMFFKHNGLRQGQKEIRIIVLNLLVANSKKLMIEYGVVNYKISMNVKVDDDSTYN